ncbi:unnamed protein product [Rotaria sp. Silwood2]|nr:unnamed protein product [Rotaria sp. Silwood2]CAF4409107.1 unnamed protein product [Rotaria sp. Silwood2]
MFSFIYSILLFSIASISCIQIPFIQNVTLIPKYNWNSTTITNKTCEQCLCIATSIFVALNYFPNNTCQLFYTFPISYKIISTPQARLYFPQKIFPNATQCCMPNLGYLLDKLKNGTWTYVNVTSPRNILLDNNGYLVTVEMQPPKLDRFDPYNLTRISRTVIPGSNAMTVAFINNTYFIGLTNGPIVAFINESLTVPNFINSPYIQGIRDNASSDYTFAYQQLVYYPGVYGLTGYNNSYFYATSWTNNSVYSYSAAENNTSWIETRIIDASTIQNISGGTSVTIDECGRYWFSLETSVIQIFNSLGSWIGNFSLGSGLIMDTIVTDNYVMYLSDGLTSSGRIIRIDPHIEC